MEGREELNLSVGTNGFQGGDPREINVKHAVRNTAKPVADPEGE